MSAIFGIIKKNGNPVHTEELEKIRNALSHRSHQGYSETIEDNVGFGFCQLSYKKTKAKETIPLRRNNLLLVGSFDLHNTLELFKAPDNDSDIVIDWLKPWNFSDIGKLEGEYVFAAWNFRLRELVVSVDHIGFKSLYYYDDQDVFIFCSEIKGVEAAKSNANYFDEECLVDYVLRNGDTNCTYNKDIKALRGGDYLHLESGKLSKHKYWNLKPTGKFSFKQEDEWVECFKHLFTEAVLKRLHLDAKIGVSLSGGLDSSAITCLLSRILKEKNKSLYAFSSVLSSSYSGNAKDEKRYIETVKNHCPNLIVINESAEGLTPFTEVSRSFEIDESIPFSVHFMNHKILKLAKDVGINILYSGYGGDFWASSSGSFIIYKLLKEGKFLKAHKLIRQMALNYNKSSWSVFKSEYLLATRLAREYHLNRVYWKRKSCLKSKYDERYDGRAQTDSERMKESLFFGRISKSMQMVDKRSEFYGIVAANPCLDKTLLEFLADLPLEMFLLNGKRRGFFKESMKTILPEEIQNREDKGFYVADFYERLSGATDLLKEVSYDFPEIHNYFSSVRIHRLIDELGGNSDGYSNFRLFRASQVIMSSLIMKDLKKKNYVIS